jgi:hypothetical protein
MSRIGRSRMSAALGGAVLVAMTVGASVGLTLGSAPASAAGGAPKVVSHPHAKLTNSQTVLVSGKHFTPGDEVILLECLRTAALITDCNPLTAKPVMVLPNGAIPATTVTVMTGTVGTGTCGTSTTDKKDCEIAVEDLSSLSGGLSLDTIVGWANIAFKPGGSTTSTTLPTIPTTLPTIPTTLPTIPVTLPTLPTTLPTLPTTLPTLPSLGTRR